MPRKFDFYDMQLAHLQPDECALVFASTIRMRDGVILAAAKSFLRLGFPELADPLLEVLKERGIPLGFDHPWRNSEGYVDELAQRRDILKNTPIYWDPAPQDLIRQIVEDDDIPF